MIGARGLSMFGHFEAGAGAASKAEGVEQKQRRVPCGAVLIYSSSRSTRYALGQCVKTGVNGNGGARWYPGIRKRFLYGAV